MTTAASGAPFESPFELPGSWLRRVGPLFLLVFFVCYLIPAGVHTLFVLPGAGLEEAVERLWVPVLAAAGLAVATCALVPIFGRWIHTRTVAKVKRLTPDLLEPGEMLEGFCAGMFLGPRGYAGSGFLLVTDQRMLRYEDTFAGYRGGVLCRREELEALTLAQRRSAGGVKGALLRLVGTDQALIITSHGRREHALVLAEPVRTPFCDWLGARGFEVGFRNDEDLPASPEREQVELVSKVVPGERRNSAVLLLVSLAVMLVFVGGGMFFVVPREPSKPKPAWMPPPFVTSQPGIPKREVQFSLVTTLPKLAQRGGNPPQGTERLLAEIRVATAPVRSPSGSTSRGLCVYQVVRIGKQGLLRIRAPRAPKKGGGARKPLVMRWELLGKPGDTDGALVDAAEQRLSRPEPSSWRSGG